MINTQRTRRRKLVAAAMLAATVVALLAAVAIASRSQPGSAARGGPCSGAEQPAEQASAKELRKAVRCLINRERAERDLGPLARDRSLKRAAQAHTKTMAATDCLAHECAGEPDLEQRLRRAGYFDGTENWRFAENTGCGLSAEAMVANWMATDFHRVNILERSFDELGVGVAKKRVKGRCEPGFATFAVVVGWREATAETVR
jgi:uncharacterized protein YkwD